MTACMQALRKACLPGLVPSGDGSHRHQKKEAVIIVDALLRRQRSSRGVLGSWSSNETVIMGVPELKPEGAYSLGPIPKPGAPLRAIIARPFNHRDRDLIIQHVVLRIFLAAIRATGGT
ncbi:hypothetical protein NDU88_010552 [Pleurodeles waltl]|uniref:Uncharacterized protein n=1 Tax=Pleurodeles waltl TaxID=8319 RepID=A0AAV7S288_PLEWA|nr:hypothetical protein NDU88_010552 [Pleurodeles waltl]